MLLFMDSLYNVRVTSWAATTANFKRFRKIFFFFFFRPQALGVEKFS